MSWWSLPLLLAALPQTLFVLQYGIPQLGAGQWWRDPIGRALFIKAAALAIVLDLFVLWVVFPESWISTAMLVGYWLVFLGVLYQFVALNRSRRHERGRWL